MKRHPYAASLLGMGIMALMAAPVPADEMTEGERKTPPPPAPPAPLPEPCENLPGETNRQFAARMRATATRNSGDEG